MYSKFCPCLILEPFCCRSDNLKTFISEHNMDSWYIIHAVFFCHILIFPCSFFYHDSHRFLFCYCFMMSVFTICRLPILYICYSIFSEMKGVICFMQNILFFFLFFMKFQVFNLYWMFHVWSIVLLCKILCNNV